MKTYVFITIVITALISVMAFGLVGVAWYYDAHGGTVEGKGVVISNFKECVDAGYPVMESYPRQCTVKGHAYTEVIVNTNANVNSNTNSVVNGNANTAVDTTGWKTYTNASFGYSIKYPSDWPIEPQDSSTKSVVTIGNTPAEPSAGPFGVYVKKSDADLAAFIKSYKQGFPDGCGQEGSITFAGQTWTTLDCKEAFAGQNKKSFFITHLGSIYHLYYIEGSESINQTFNTIRTTFIFLADTTGWKTYTSTETYTTEDFHSFHSTASNQVSYTLKYPENWNLSYTVFDDQNKNKIAEFSPGGVLLKEGQDCSNHQKPDRNGWPVEELSREAITIGNYSGVKIIQKSAVDGGDISQWYPIRYCLQSGRKAFIINFYELELGKGNRALFESIVSTLKFN
jgi:hypothetical protein